MQAELAVMMLVLQLLSAGTELASWDLKILMDTVGMV